MTTLNKHKTLILSLILGISFTANAQKKLYISGTRLTRPLVEKWADEYNKTQKDVTVAWAGREISSDSVPLKILAFQLSEKEVKPGYASIVIARYTQLAIANSQRSDLKELQLKGFTEADFKKIYFSTERGEVASGKSPIVIYKREKPACAAVAFAGHYSSDPNKAPGVGVNGDDKDLSKAVKRDPNGLSYNNLGFIYDVKTRKVADSLAVIPLDLNENGKIDTDEQIYASLDDVITFIEKTNHPKIPTEVVNVIFNKETKSEAEGKFLNWILTDGQQYNRAYGFINQTTESLDNQKNVIASNYKVSGQSCTGLEKVQRKSTTKANP